MLRLSVQLLTGTERCHWLNPFLLAGLFGLKSDHDLQTDISLIVDQRPHEYARNIAAHSALSTGADWLLMIDNDQVIPTNFDALIKDADKDPNVNIVCGYSWLHKGRPCTNVWQDENNLMPERLVLADGPGFQEIAQGSSGVMLIRRNVLETIPQPWFHMPLDDRSGAILDGEDTAFCKLARQHGFRIHTHSQFPCDHLKTTSLRSVAEVLAGTRTEWGIDLRPSSPQ